MTSSPPARRFGWNNLAIRLASAAVLAPAVVIATSWAPSFLLMLAIAIALMAIEWGQMSAPRAPLRVAAAITGSVLVAVFTAYLGYPICGLGADADQRCGRGALSRATSRSGGATPASGCSILPRRVWR